MKKLIGLLMLLCSVCAACGSTGTDSAVLDPAGDRQPAGPGAPTGTSPAVLEPVGDRRPADPGAPTSRWVEGVNAAGWGFHRHLEGNAVSSPVSIGMAFSLSRAGASPGSGAALDKIFGFFEPGAHDAANAVDLSLAESSSEPTILEVANRLFPDDGFSPSADFLDTASAQYGATIEPIDTDNGASAADAINDWVSETTRGLIPKIVDPGAVAGQKLVLVNTVYLKADWAVPFSSESTRIDKFATGENQTVTVPFMRDTSGRRYTRLDGADAVELPYEGGDLAMWLIVPHDLDGLAAVEDSLDAAALASLPVTARHGRVFVKMPKWEQTLPPADLFAWLCPLGFCPGAGFDGIAPKMAMTGALHSAKAIVDENGTEAAAVTAIMDGITSEEEAPPIDLEVIADRPFLWVITHQPTGAILFIGRLVNPAA